MKLVKNNPKEYERREVIAPSRKTTSKSVRAEALKRFLDAPISADLYIDLSQPVACKA